MIQSRLFSFLCVLAPWRAKTFRPHLFLGVKPFCSLLVAAFLLVSCEQTPDEEYKPPVLTGKAYVLAAADHIAVVNLSNQELSRVDIGTMAVGLAATPKGVYLLSESGELGRLPEAAGEVIDWKKISDTGVALTNGANGELFALGNQEIVRMSNSGEVLARFAVAEEISAITFDPRAQQLWLFSRKTAKAQTLSAEGKVGPQTVDLLGNSIHRGFVFSAKNELWIAEGNEYMNGKPYGVGFMKKGASMPGGINVVDLATGKQNDFIMVGGNVVDLVLDPDGTKVYAAVSRLPEYKEATLSIVGSESRRVHAELRLCLSCHETEGVVLKEGQAEVRALAVVWK